MTWDRAYYERRYADRKANGDCTRCGARAKEGRTHCAGCDRKLAFRWKGGKADGRGEARSSLARRCMRKVVNAAPSITHDGRWDLRLDCGHGTHERASEAPRRARCPRCAETGCA